MDNNIQTWEVRLFFILFSVSSLYPIIEADRYLNDHAKKFVRKLRTKTYSLLLESFKSVYLSYGFGLREKFLVAAGKDQVLVFTQEVLILPWASGQVVISNLIDHYCMCSNNEFLLH